MRFELDEASSLLKTSTRGFLEKECPMAKARAAMDESAEGFSRDLYRRLGELGYFGLTLAEDHGGSASGALGLVAVLEEMGRAAMPGPYLDLVLAAEILHRSGKEQAAHLLGELLSGAKLVLAARSETLIGEEPTPPAARFSQGRVRGKKFFVPFGASADCLLITTADGIVAAERPAAGWGQVALETFDHSQRFVEIEFDTPAESIADAASSGGILETVDRLGSLGGAALLLGLMQRSLELTVAYLKERHAFGRPIGSFQALQHRAADMLLAAESSRSAVYRAAWAMDHSPAEAPLLVATAKAYAGDSARLVCGEAIQMFGGVGFTWEYDPHIFFKRVKTLEQRYGSTRWQLEAALKSAGI